MMQKARLYIELWVISWVVAMAIHYTAYQWLMDLWEFLFYPVPWRH